MGVASGAMSAEGAAAEPRRTITWRGLWPWLAFGLLLGVAFLLDWPVYYALPHLPRSPLVWFLLGTFRRYGNYNVYYVIFVPLVLVLGYWRKDARAIFTGKAGCVGAAVTTLIVYCLKYSTGRARPISMLIGIQPRFYGPSLHFHSFPSGDVAAAFCFAYVMSGYFPRLRWLLYANGAVIAFERLMLVAHFTSDVIAGAAAGVLAGWIATRLVEWWDRRMALRRQGLAAG